MDFRQHYIDETLRGFQRVKSSSEKAFNQISEEEWFYKPDPESNSIAILVKHMAGNMFSRWTDFYTTDGEKATRMRDTEFEEDLSVEDLIKYWESAWELLLNLIGNMQPEDLDRTVTIRNEPHTVIQAIMRQYLHYSYHSGQIVQLAKHIKGETWQTMSIPKGKSEEFFRDPGQFKHNA